MNYWENCPHGVPVINCVYCTSVKTRNDTIEECARVVEVRGNISSRSDYQELLQGVAAAIRALKDKSCPKD